MPQPLMAPGSPETCGKSAGSGALAAPWSSGARAPQVAFPVPEPSRARHQLCSWQGRATQYIPAEAGGAAPTGGNSSRWWPRDGQCWDKPCPTSAHTSLPLCIPGDGGLGSSVPGREQSEEGLSKQTGQVWDLCWPEARAKPSPALQLTPLVCCCCCCCCCWGQSGSPCGWWDQALRVSLWS